MKAFEEYPEIYEKYLLFFFSNRGWSGSTVNPKVESLVDEISLSKLMENLPHRSSMFPKLFREEMKVNKDLRDYCMNTYDYDEDQGVYKCFIVSKRTKFGRCCHKHCITDKECSFIHQFKIFYIPNFDVFQIDVLVKGSHGTRFCLYKSAFSEIPMTISMKWNRREEKRLYETNLEGWRT
jgi:hypothetical protein